MRRELGEMRTPGARPATDETALRAGEEIRLLLEVASEIAEARDFRHALESALGALCAVGGCAAAQAWVPGRDRATLHCAAFRAAADEEAAGLRALSEGWKFESGAGLPGRAFATRAAATLPPDEEGAVAARDALARGLGIDSAAALPVSAGDETVAVLEVFARDGRAHEPGFLRLLSAVASLLGAAARLDRARSAAGRAEGSFRRAFDDAPIGMAMVGSDFRLARVNKALCEMLGYAPGELMRMTLLDLAHPDDADRAARLSTSLFAGEIASYRLEERCRRKDGQFVAVHLTCTAIRDAKGRARYELRMMESVAERKRLEDQLRQSQKMEAIGRLAGGVAHDFNNLLTVIRGYCDLLLARFRDDEAARRDLVEIARAGERGTALTRQLLAFSRKQVLEPRVLELNTIVLDMQKMLRRLIGEDIELVVSLAPGLGRIHADQSQIEQVILNLSVNARDAMPNGGRLTIETANADFADGAAPPGVAAGRYVRLAVRDTGAGMDAETQSHLFEPFYTTKPHGEGTGLGLSTVYGIVKQSGGHLHVESELGRGSAFEIYLPRVDQECEPTRAPPRAAAPGEAHETILLVEDDHLVRELALRILRSHGYRVLEARGGGEALRIARAHEGPIHALVTDVVMPEMSGRELFASLAALREGLRVLFLSGYAPEQAGGEGAFLQKPFAPDDLVRRVREVLDAKAAIR